MTRVTLVDGPLAGYHPDIESVAEGVPLRFHGEPLGYRQFVYHLTGRDATSGEPIYEWQGDDTSTPIPLDTVAYELPPHVSILTTVAVVERDGLYWLEVDNHGKPGRMIGVSEGPYNDARDAEGAARRYARAANTGGLNDPAAGPARERRGFGDA